MKKIDAQKLIDNKKIELYKEKPKEGEFFGIITNVECFAPYYSDKSSYIYEGNIIDTFETIDNVLSNKNIIEKGRVLKYEDK